MNDKRDKIVNEIIGILKTQDWKPAKFSGISTRKEYYICSLRYRPQGIKHLYIGRWSYPDLEGVFLCAQPSSPNGTKRLMNEGFKHHLPPGWGNNWFFKRLISDDNIIKLHKMTDTTKRNVLIKLLLNNTYPFIYWALKGTNINA
ncbi:MAG: hypothetical protein AB1599_00915 [Planctomycetota bacterium]